MTAAMPPLVAVIGPVEPALLAAFTVHYQRLGVTTFHLAFHFPEHVPQPVKTPLLAAAAALDGPPPILSEGPWHEHLHARLRDQLRTAAGPGWHLIADSDEFHAYPAPIPDMIAAAQDAGSLTIGGVLLDRVTANGSLAAWDPTVGLDATFPLGGFLTGLLLGGDPRKIVLADSRVGLALGSHRSPGRRPANTPPVPVHHFKWRRGIEQDLQRRITQHTAGTWHEISPAIRTEAARLLEHLAAHGERIHTAGPVAFRPVDLASTPPWWPNACADLLDRWRPPGSGPC
ncbi:hypothetical protein AB0F17_59530 [Nonomuraea sp. NPDC026600]|uniref:hypothetical protein n=1 Tax=Nonomuraea sp. NPDC026600 TaxID=3155363 RepID=UPI0033DF2DF4